VKEREKPVGRRGCLKLHLFAHVLKNCRKRRDKNVNTCCFACGRGSSLFLSLSLAHNVCTRYPPTTAAAAFAPCPLFHSSSKMLFSSLRFPHRRKKRIKSDAVHPTRVYIYGCYNFAAHTYNRPPRSHTTSGSCFQTRVHSICIMTSRPRCALAKSKFLKLVLLVLYYSET